MIKDIDIVKGVTYLNERRFEAAYTNFGIRRQRAIEFKKHCRIFDLVLIVGVIFLFLFLSVEIVTIFKGKLEIAAKDRDIKYLESTLDKILYENEVYYDLLRSKVDIDTLKRIAYIDLGMVAPTENNIIYFDKSDMQNVPIS